MILKPGNKVLVVHRRLFEGDRGRFFLGAVDEYENGISTITGYTFVREHVDGMFLRKEEPRTKIISLSAGTLIVYRLPEDLVIADVQITVRENRLVLADQQGFEMNLSEHGF